jgi:hypothetical protein
MERTRHFVKMLFTCYVPSFVADRTKERYKTIFFFLKKSKTKNDFASQVSNQKRVLVFVYGYSLL